ncbi:MAG: hypothetical protein D6795_19305, partial [Deltaproteobacteria bacterium]
MGKAIPFSRKRAVVRTSIDARSIRRKCRASSLGEDAFRPLGRMSLMNEKSERHETTDESAVPPRDPTFVPPSKQRRTEVSEEDLLDRLVDTQELTETLKAQALARLLETDGIIESTAPPSGEGEDSKRERTDHAQSRAEALERIAAQLAEAQGGTCDDEKARRRSTSPPPQGGKGQEVASPAQPSSVPPKGRAAARARILQRSAYRHPPGSPKREWVSPYQAFRKRREAAKREAAKREAALRRQRREGEAERTFETWHRNDLLLLFSLLFAWRFFATLWSGDAGYTDSTLLHLIDLCSGTLLLLLLHPTLIGKAGRVGSVILAGS